MYPEEEIPKTESGQIACVGCGATLHPDSVRLRPQLFFDEYGRRIKAYDMICPECRIETVYFLTNEEAKMLKSVGRHKLKQVRAWEKMGAIDSNEFIDFVQELEKI